MIYPKLNYSFLFKSNKCTKMSSFKFYIFKIINNFSTFINLLKFLKYLKYIIFLIFLIEPTITCQEGPYVLSNYYFIYSAISL